MMTGVASIRCRFLQPNTHSRVGNRHPVAIRGVPEKIGVAVSTVVASGLLLCGGVEAVSTENLLFLEAWRAVDRAYVDKTFNKQNWLQIRERFLGKESMINRTETYAAIEKMLKSLDDPFTRFLEPARYAALKTGVVIGVGLEVVYGTGSNDLVVLASLPKSPAARVGIETGDVLAAINGESTENDSLDSMREKLQGEAGTEVYTGPFCIMCSPNRSREEVIYDPVITQYCSKIGSTTTDDQPQNTGYIQILRFTNQTTIDVQKSMRKLKAEGVDRILLDLRNNGGGSFPAGVSVARMFLDDGDIVLIADTEGVRDIVSVEGEGLALDSTTPLTVLVNRGTASASEVLSGALQDNSRGVIAGETSFGKGLIQTLVPLSDGSALTVTTAKYQTPSGRDINGLGIKPDIPLPSEAGYPFGDDDEFCVKLRRAESSFKILRPKGP